MLFKVKKLFLKYKQGFSLIEVIIAVGVFGLLASGVFYTVTSSYSNFYGIGDRQTVTEFAQEGIEAVRAIRDDNWRALQDQLGAPESPSGYGVDQGSDGLWYFTGANTRGDLTRVVSLATVQRDSNGEIVDSGGTVDPDTMKITVTISGSGMQDYVLNSYLTNWQYRTWQQTDWSGVGSSEFWSDITLASSSVTKMSTSTAGVLILTPTFGSWQDLASDANITLTGTSYDLEISPDGNTMFVTGDQTQDFRYYDISQARSGTITASSTIVWPVAMTGISITVNPNGQYAYVGLANASGGTNALGILNLSSDSITGAVSVGTTTVSIMDLVIDSNGEYLYALTNLGEIFCYEIGGGGSTLTLQNASNIYFLGLKGDAVNNGWIDTDNDALYVVTDKSDTDAVVRVDIFDPTTLAVDYASPANPADIVDVIYLETSSGNNRMITLGEYTSIEFAILEDNGSGFSLLGTYNLSGGPFKSVIYDGLDSEDGSDVALAYDYYARLYSVDVSNRSSLSAGPVSDTTSYGDTAYSLPYGYMDYSDSLGGAFILEKTGSTHKLHFLKRPDAYQPSGTLVSSIFDLGSSNKELDKVIVEQNVPAGCGLEITLEASDNIGFTSPITQTVSDTSDGYYASTTVDGLNGKRWLRYQVDMTACGTNNVNTPTLYDLKIRYR